MKVERLTELFELLNTKSIADSENHDSSSPLKINYTDEKITSFMAYAINN